MTTSIYVCGDDALGPYVEAPMFRSTLINGEWLWMFWRQYTFARVEGRWHRPAQLEVHAYSTFTDETWPC